jgi:hypothetical protein
VANGVRVITAPSVRRFAVSFGIYNSWVVSEVISGLIQDCLVMCGVR